MQLTRRRARKIVWIFYIIVVITIFFVYIAIHRNLPSQLTEPDRLNSQTTSSTRSNTTISTSTNQRNKSIVTSTTTLSSPINMNVTYYELINDIRYHYEFRFEYNKQHVNNDTRLMILFNGSVRTCVDYWNFAVGRRILHLLHSFHFSILVICSKKRTYDLQRSVKGNADAKWIYTYLQKWMNDVYYKLFQNYPRLYIHGISRGSRMAGLLCRILPIQHQILTIFPGDEHGMLTPSDYPIDLQRRLQLDPVFANWFYFDFCYKPTLTNSTLSEFCPFQSDKYYYQPVPPTYFIHVQNDRLFNTSHYTLLMDNMRKDALLLGGKRLSLTKALQLYVITPLNVTSTYMQENFDTWQFKPHASDFFYQHYVNRSQYDAEDVSRRTCQCLPTDFRYYEFYPNITQKWSQQQQKEYRDYADDIAKHTYSFCEDICGDLGAYHAMTSRHLDQALQWINRMDKLRHYLLIDDYLSRPLRIWMYNKTSIIPNNHSFSSNQPNYTQISNQYQMYSPEYYLQDYFERLQALANFSRHNLQWADNPLLADYFIIPSDLTYHYFYPDVSTMSLVKFKNRVDKLNTDYFERLLTNIRVEFPYWSMAKQADQFGSNHILTILEGRNMGVFYNHTQRILKNVIQIVFTGLRQDMLSSDTPPPHDLRGMPIIYRHRYDVVIPQFTRPIASSNRSRNITNLVQKKKIFLFFAGAFTHSITSYSARRLLWTLWSNITEKHTYNTTIEMEGKRYDTLTMIRGHQSPRDYIKSMQSTVFALCPEGFFWWSPRLYDAIQLGAIPLILADNIVLPFERFIDWPSFTIKINVSNIANMIDLIQRIDNFEQYISQKLTNVQQYIEAFRWPYSNVRGDVHNKHDFLLDEDKNGTTRNTLHYISLELRCRRLEQMYGLTSDSSSSQSIDAQEQVCQTHANICPCYGTKRPVAFRQYL